jgi:excinuclease ABC subunit C
MKGNQEALKDIFRNLPKGPGVYLFLDQHNNIIYIGKAKNLKNRVASYFLKKKFENNKIKLLIKNTTDIRHIVVETESDALLLENNLIKEHQPKYNINLKDDKSFPWICVKNEPFPRVFSTRNLINDGSKYYGPYTSAGSVRTLLSLIRKLYPLRNCNYNLNQENILKGKYKVCLEYHLGNCKGPCEGLQKEEDYNHSIAHIHNILKGNIKDIILFLEKKMRIFSGKYDFENALIMKEKLEALKKFQLKTTIVNNTISNVDILSIFDDKSKVYVNFIKVVDGAIIQSHNVEIKRVLNEPKEELLEFALTDLRYRLKSDAKEVILPMMIENIPPGVKISVPKMGDKKKLLELSERNAKIFMLDKKRQNINISQKKSTDRILEKLKTDLRMQELPVHIECFDNSNIQGSNPVAACVVFKYGKPSKNEYRHYNIKGVSGPDDYASMKEVLERRFSKLLENKSTLPQLIVIDGGKGQLSAAISSLETLGLRGKIAVIGIAKRLEEIYFPDDPVPIYLDKNSESLKLIQNLRNEAHRFGIDFHRLKRSNSMVKSELTGIKGIGEETMKKLILKFHSLDGVKTANPEDLIKLVGKAKAKLIMDDFNRKG